MIIDTSEQGSEGWFQARLGVPSASKFSEIVTTKGEPSKSREKYLFQLAAERITGKKEETYKNAVMERGNILEAEARDLLSLVEDVDIVQVGFCKHDSGLYGCSPDGLIGEDGGCEIKNPLSHTHIKYLLDDRLPTDYFQQVQGSLLCTSRSYWFFISNYPGIKPLIKKIYPDEAFIAKLHCELMNFCQELEYITEKIRQGA